jgi:leader peptidase (prepilin peptidase) / N-methyltransferase
LILLRRPGPLACALALALTLSGFAVGRFGWTARGWSLFVLLTALSLIVVLDLQARVIPDAVTLPGLAYALGVSAVLETPPLADAALGALVCGAVVLVFAVISRGQVGGGDIKLMAMIGAALGLKPALLVLGLSQIIGAILIVGLMVVRRRRLSTGFPIGSVIALLGAVVLVGSP